MPTPPSTVERKTLPAAKERPRRFKPVVSPRLLLLLVEVVRWCGSFGVCIVIIEGLVVVDVADDVVRWGKRKKASLLWRQRRRRRQRLPPLRCIFDETLFRVASGACVYVCIDVRGGGGDL